MRQLIDIVNENVLSQRNMKTANNGPINLKLNISKQCLEVFPLNFAPIHNLMKTNHYIFEINQHSKQ